jgi:hypothetical protein
MNSFANQSKADRTIATFDRLADSLSSGVINHWDDCYPMKPATVPGAEIKDDLGNSYDPPQFEPEQTVMVPDIEASQEFWDAIGTAGFPLCASHAIMANAANFKHLLAGGELAANDSVMQAGLALMGAALAFRAACEAKGEAFMAALPVKVVPPFELVPDATGKITLAPKTP